MTEKELLDICIDTNATIYDNIFEQKSHSDILSIRTAAINIIDKKLKNYIVEVPESNSIGYFKGKPI